MRISDWSSDVCSSDLAERSREEYVDAIRADLGWLGLAFDGEERQSARFALYEQRFDTLKAAGRVYPCYETAQELDLKRKVLLGRGLPPVYDRGALALSDEDKAAFEAEGRRPHWRFRLDHRSEERRVGKEWGSTCRSGWARTH